MTHAAFLVVPRGIKSKFGQLYGDSTFERAHLREFVTCSDSKPLTSTKDVPAKTNQQTDERCKWLPRSCERSYSTLTAL
jgi:hypothetical protein